ncbi:hypothetical protein ScPMuIL_001341 [Solemya velum]
MFQTFGSSNKKQLGLTVQKALVILILACIPCWTIFLNAEHLLVLIGEKSSIARLSGQYTVMFIAGLPGYVITQVLSKYLQSQSIVFPSMIIGVIANVFNAAYHAVFILVLNWDIRGAALAVVLTEWTLVILHVCYICFSGIYRSTWTGWSSKCFDDWGEFMRLAIPGLLMVCLEWWSFEILTFVTGLLGNAQLDAHAIVFSIEGLTFMVPLGISVSAAVRVGNHLGGGDTIMAMTSSKVAIIMGLCAALFTSMLIMAFKEIIPLMFSEDRAVVSLATRLFPLLAFMHLFDASQGVSSGVIRGTGNQRFGALVNLVAYYMLALPVAVPLMFKTSIGVAGAWWGMIISTVFQAITFWIKIGVMDWDKATQKAETRACMASMSRTSSVSIYRDSCSPVIQTRDVSFTGDTQELVEADHLTLSETSSRRSEDSDSPTCSLSPLQVLIMRRSILIAVLFVILIAGIEECPSCAHIADSVSHWNRCHNCPHSIDIKGCTNCPHTVENVPQLFSPKIMLEDSWSIPLCPRLTDPVLTLYINCP